MFRDGIYHVFTQHPQDDGDVLVRRAGRYMISDGKLAHLEDYHGLLSRMAPEGPLTPASSRRIAAMHTSPYMQVVSHDDIRSGKYLGDVPEADLPPPPKDTSKRPPSVFEYHRAGMDKPHLVEVQGNRSLLDGVELKPEEMATILQNVRAGAATLRYQRGRALSKMEGAMQLLRKADEDMTHEEAMAHLGQLINSGTLDPKTEAAGRKVLYGDPMVRGVGNKYAATEFLRGNKPGVYMSMDANDFRDINNTHGHSVGDEAIRGIGGAMRSAMDTAVGSQHGKLFRNGGDEFVAHVPTQEHAAAFARQLRTNLEQMPLIGGTHRPSVSIGMGHDFDTADKVALARAKEQKFHPPLPGQTEPMRKYPVGQVPHLLGHSMLPGAEGPIGMQERFPLPPPSIRQPAVSSTGVALDPAVAPVVQHPAPAGSTT